MLPPHHSPSWRVRPSSLRSVLVTLVLCLVSTFPQPLYDISHEVLGEDECIAMVAAAESTGWTQQHDSIEQAKNAQDLYVYVDGKIMHKELFTMLLPRLPGLASLVSKRRLSERDEEPVVGMPDW